MKRFKSVLAFVAAVICWPLAGPADASLTLTAAGIADGFTLSTFVSGYSGSYGPLAQGILPSGNVLTGSLLNSSGAFGPTIFVFTDVDGHTLPTNVSTTPYSCVTGNCNFSITTAGGQVYGGQAFGGPFLHFANNGSSTPIGGTVATDLSAYLGMWGDPVNGHIIASSNRGLVEIDPVAGTYRVINAGLFPDGVSVSPDGLIAYVENGGVIQSYSIATGAGLQTFPSTGGHGADGSGVISGGLFNGDVIVNNNDGTVGLLNPVTGLTTLIATGGTRGDFVSADLSNGTLFLSQQEQVARLGCGPGCSIGGPPPGAPEPGTLALLGLGAAVLAYSRRKKQ